VNSLRPVLAGAVGALAAVLVFAWALRARRADHGEGLVRYGGRIRAVALFVLAIGLAIAYAALHASPDQRMVAFCVAGLLLAGAVWFVLETFFVRAIVSAAHLTHTSPWRGTRRILWSAITRHQFSPEMSWHVLETTGYGKVRLSSYMSGVDQIIDRLKGSPMTTERP
jgi:hypothetical protein